MKVILRPLKIRDAKISWKWRNDKEVWKLTGRNWDNHVSEEIEEEWIKEVIKQKDSRRFAICVGEDEQYIGNVQLTQITDKDAVFHIFIGEKKFWGKGIGKIATKLILDYAGNDFNFEMIKLYVNKLNKAAIKIYEKVGFKIIDTKPNDNYSMIYKSRTNNHLLTFIAIQQTIETLVFF